MEEIQSVTTQSSVTNPDGSTMPITHSGFLPIPGASLTARKALVVSTLQHPLLSIGQLCDDGMTATFTKSDVAVTSASGDLVLAGVRNASTNQLFLIDLHNQPIAQNQYKAKHSSVAAALHTQNRYDALASDDEDYDDDADDSLSDDDTVIVSPLVANESLYIKRKVSDQVKHMHAVMFSPTQSTLQGAAKRGYLSTLPGLTNAAVRSNPVNTVATAQGHLNRIRQGIKSTKPKRRRPRAPSPPPAMPGQPDEDLLHSGLRDVPADCSAPKIFVRNYATGTLHADATAAFPVKSISGNEFVNVFYIEGANFIKPVAMASNSAAANIAAFDEVIEYCTSHGITPDFARLDNNTSHALEQHLRAKNIGFQYVPPGNHRANDAEWALKVFKNHFIAGLCSADAEFDIALWDHLLTQATITLNLMRSSAINPRISAWEQLEGPYDFDRHPLHRPGCKVVSFVGPSERGPWSPHGDVGFYLGPALDHYRCFHIWIPKTRAYRIVDSVSFHPKSDNATSTDSPPVFDITNDVAVPSDPATAVHRAINVYLPLLAADRTNSTLLSTLQSAQHLLSSPITPDTSAPSATQRVPDPPASTSQRVPVAGQGDWYPIERIVRHRSLKSAKPYLVKWLDYDHTHNSWEPLSSLQGTVAYLEYVAQHPTVFNVTPFVAAPPQLTPANLSTKTRRKRTTRNSTKTASSVVLNYPVNLIVPPNSSGLSRAAASKIADTMHAAVQSEPPFSMSTRDLLADLFYTSNAATYDPTTGDTLTWSTAMKGPHSEAWTSAMDAELEQLFVTYDNMHLIHFSDIPQDRLISYFNPQLKMKLNAELLHVFRIRGTYGGNRSDYEGDKAAYTADMPTLKILLNLTVSDPDRKFMTADIVSMYLHTRLERKEYMSIDLKFFSPAARLRYGVDKFIQPGSTKVYVEILGGIYGLPQAGLLAQQKLLTHLSTHGFHQVPHTTCLFRHETRPIEFTLVVDDFGISYKSKGDADYLIKTLELIYPLTVDITGSSYLGYTIEDVGTGPDRVMKLSMPRYVQSALNRFGVVTIKNVLSPEHFTPISYATKEAQLTAIDTTPPLSADNKTRLQSIIGVMLYYARAVDGTMLGTCNRLASQQANPTQKTLDAAHHLLDYAATYPDAKLEFRPSDMILRMDSDASYNSETGARSRASYCAWLGKKDDPSFINGFIDVVSAIIPTVVSSASEAEYAALFIAAKNGLCHRYTLHDIDCFQPPTIITTDNSVAKGIATSTCKVRRSKSIDMRYHWLRDRVALKDFDIVWHPGVDSLADFNTKIQPTSQVLKMRHYYVKDTGPKFSTARKRRTETRQATA